MSGRKLEQTKDALLSMLDEMKEKNIDSFNILVFSDSHQTWEVQGDPFVIQHSKKWWKNL
jgi:hypothetical protein